MQIDIVPLTLTCSPLLLAAFSCAMLLRLLQSGRRPRPSSLIAIGGNLLIAGYAACIFFRYSMVPPLHLPAWKDPETLDLGLLFLLAPAGFGLAIHAGVRGGSKWVVIPLIVGSVILFLVGLLEGVSV
jgi:hypothetical protein